MRDGGSGFKVTKNRLAGLALEGHPVPKVWRACSRGRLRSPSRNDPVAAAKVAVDYAKSNPKLMLLGGALGGQMLDAEGVKALATLPSLDELRGQDDRPAQRAGDANRGRCCRRPGGQLARVSLQGAQDPNRARRRNAAARFVNTRFKPIGVSSKWPIWQQLVDQSVGLDGTRGGAALEDARREMGRVGGGAGRRRGGGSGGGGGGGAGRGADRVRRRS